MKASTFFLGLAAGTVAAAITVLYSTPKSGVELRTSVKSASTDMFEKFKDVKLKTAELKESVSHMAKEAKELIPEAVNGIHDSIEQWNQATVPNKEQLEKEIAAIQTAIENLEQTLAAQQK